MSCIPEEMQATFELHLISQYAHNWKAPLFYLIEEILKNAEDPYTEIYNIYNRDRTLAEKILIFQ